MPHCVDAFSLQAILAAGQSWPQALRGASCADPGTPCVGLLHAPDSRRDARSSISEILCQSSDNPLCLVFLGSTTPVFSSLKQTSFDDHHCLLVLTEYSVTTTLVSAFTHVKKKGMWLLSIVPGLYIAPSSWCRHASHAHHLTSSP